MKILISFYNHRFKNQILNMFTHKDNIKANDICFIIDNYIKIDYSHTKLNIYCYDLKVADKILSNIEITEDIEHIMINTTVKDFNGLIKEAHKGQLKHINTELNELSFEATFNDINIIINIKNNNAIIELKLPVNEGYVKHPMLYLNTLYKYLDYNTNNYINTYTYYYKYLYSANGFKKYSKFLNENKHYIYDGLSYTYNFNNGYLKFLLNDVSLAYPNVIEFKSYDVNDIDFIKQLNKFFNINTIQEITVSEGIKYNDNQLNEFNYIKSDNFFEYIKTENNIRYIYNIYEYNLKQIKNISL